MGMSKRIWFRVGMEAFVTDSELSTLQKGGRKADELMERIIERGWLSGETYILSADNGLDGYDNPESEINFLY